MSDMGQPATEQLRVGGLVRFYLGTHQPHWLRFAGVPLFVSRRRLNDLSRLPVACAPWSLDSGGFTELQMYGQWTMDEREYAASVYRFSEEIGGLEWAAPQDWMCEPIVISGGVAKDGTVFAGTGLSVAEHQRRTVQNYLELRRIAKDLPWIPVLQGWELHDYLECVRMYERAGVDLRKERTVGVGTVCRRQDTTEAAEIMAALAALGFRLHGFGYKISGLVESAKHLVSADSMAWSSSGRRDLIPGHDKPGPRRRFGHKNCANCFEYAMEWRTDLLERWAA